MNNQSEKRIMEKEFIHINDAYPELGLSRSGVYSRINNIKRIAPVLSDKLTVKRNRKTYLTQKGFELVQIDPGQIEDYLENNELSATVTDTSDNSTDSQKTYKEAKFKSKSEDDKEKNATVSDTPDSTDNISDSDLSVYKETLDLLRETVNILKNELEEKNKLLKAKDDLILNLTENLRLSEKNIQRQQELTYLHTQDQSAQNLSPRDSEVVEETVTTVTDTSDSQVTELTDIKEEIGNLKETIKSIQPERKIGFTDKAKVFFKVFLGK